MTYEENINILIEDGCSRHEAERHLKNGTIIYDSVDEYIQNEYDNGFRDDLIEQYGEDEEALREAIKDGRVEDVSYVNGKVIMYFL